MASYESISLLNEHRGAMNDISTLAQQELISFLNKAVDLPSSSFDIAIRNGIPNVIAPYTSVASQVGTEYYGLVREVSQKETNSSYPAFDLIPPTYLPDTASKTYVGAGTGLKIINDNGFATFADTVNFFGGITQKSIFNASRETTNILGAQDESFKRSRRVPSANACAWCYFMFNTTEVNSAYHDYCRCTPGVEFTGDKANKYVQIYNESYNKDYDAAKKILEDGATGRTLRKGTPAYEVAIRSELNAPARDWRKNFEDKKNLTKEQAANQRVATKNMVNNISSKISNKEVLNSKELASLNAWGIDVDNLISTKRTSNSVSSENILSIMRKQFNYR